MPTTGETESLNLLRQHLANARAEMNQLIDNRPWYQAQCGAFQILYPIAMAMECVRSNEDHKEFRETLRLLHTTLSEAIERAPQEEEEIHDAVDREVNPRS
jgi:hypothetical protein